MKKNIFWYNGRHSLLNLCIEVIYSLFALDTGAHCSMFYFETDRTSTFE